MGVACGIGGLAGTAFQTVLADYHRPSLARLDVFRHQENSIGKDAGPDIQNHFVAAELWLIVDQACAWMRRCVGIGHATDDLVPDVVAVELRAGLPLSG